MALIAAGAGPGDEVICPALMVITDAYASIHLGATPVFADVDPDTLNISARAIADKCTPRTKAILVVSMEGLPVDMDPIMALAKEHNLIMDGGRSVL